MKQNDNAFERECDVCRRKYHALLAEDHAQSPNHSCQRTECPYIHNLKPRGKASYILVAKEPRVSINCDDFEGLCMKGLPNFFWDENDTVVRYCIERTLATGSDDYYLTDLSKGALQSMCTSGSATRRYKRWLPSLRDELEDLTEPDTRIIAIGKDALEHFTRGPS